MSKTVANIWSPTPPAGSLPAMPEVSEAGTPAGHAAPETTSPGAQRQTKKPGSSHGRRRGQNNRTGKEGWAGGAAGGMSLASTKKQVLAKLAHQYFDPSSAVAPQWVPTPGPPVSSRGATYGPGASAGSIGSYGGSSFGLSGELATASVSEADIREVDGALRPLRRPGSQGPFGGGKGGRKPKSRGAAAMGGFVGTPSPYASVDSAGLTPPLASGGSLKDSHTWARVQAAQVRDEFGFDGASNWGWNRSERAMLSEWLNSYEGESMSYSSKVIESEAALRQALVYARHLGSPNPLTTAVAFRMLDNVSRVFGRFQELMTAVTGVLREAVYVTPPAIEDISVHFPGGLRVQEYFQMAPYFGRLPVLKRENEELRKLTEDLSNTLQALEEAAARDAATEASKQRAKKRWRKLRVAELLTRAEHAVASETGDMEIETPVDRVVNLFEKLNEEDRLAAMRGVVAAMSLEMHGEVMHMLMGLLTADELAAVFTNYIEHAADCTDKHVETVTESLMDSSTVKRRYGARVRIVLAVFKRMSDEELRALMRKAFDEGFESAFQDVRRQVEEEVRLLREKDAADAEKKRLEARERLKAQRQARKEAAEAAQSSDTDGNAEGKGGAAARAGGKDSEATSAKGAGSGKRGSVSLDSRPGLDAMSTALAALANGDQSSFRDMLAGMDPEAEAKLREQLMKALKPECPVCHTHFGDDPTPAVGAAMAASRMETAEEGGTKRGRRGSKARSGSVAGRPRRGSRVSDAGGRSGAGSGNESDAEAVSRPSPWAKYVRKGGKKAKDIAKAANVLMFVYDCYEKKSKADEVEDVIAEQTGRFAHRRQSLPAFIKDFLLQKYGLASMADSHLRSIIACVRLNHRKNRRIGLFGSLCGVVGKRRYCERLCDVVLNMYKHLFPKFNAAVLRSRKVGLCLVPVHTALAAVEEVFPDRSLQFSLDMLELSQERRGKIVEHVKAIARPYEELDLADVLKGGSLSEHTDMPRTVSRRKSSFVRGAGAGSASSVTDADEERHVKLFEPWEVVVDVDVLLDLVVKEWWAQTDEDITDLMYMFERYDSDHNGVLSFKEFTTLIERCSPRDLQSREAMFLFNKVRDMSPGSGDAITPNAFGQLALEYGITPDRNRTEAVHHFGSMYVKQKHQAEVLPSTPSTEGRSSPLRPGTAADSIASEGAASAARPISPQADADLVASVVGATVVEDDGVESEGESGEDEALKHIKV